MFQQLPGPPRIFGRNDVTLLEGPQRPEGDVLQVPDGRRDQVECARRKLWKVFVHGPRCARYA